MSAQCKTCGAAIMWAITEAGKRMPLDAKANELGTMVHDPKRKQLVADGHADTTMPVRAFEPLFDGGRGLVRYMAHHATCPQGKEWKR